MRIQHNIMAMNAYRNYTNNTSALSKNLEKLSSGYRINRAGDDAAGLAISEKMRAQITGLKTAQKNAKDGISLVQTAEGAMTEVHDMLNRMVELADQSANGTYDDEVDRANLQKEFDALRTEIDRIADSSNFNGKKLLDGSLASTTVTGGNAAVNLTMATGTAVTPTAGKVVLGEKAQAAVTAQFSIDLSTLNVSQGGGNTNTATDVVISVSGTTMTLAVSGQNTTVSGAALAASFAISNAEVSIGGASYTVTSNGSKLVFTMTTADVEAATTGTNVNFQVTMTATGGSASVAGNLNLGTEVLSNGVAKSDGQLAHTNFTLTSSQITDGAKLTIGDKTYVFQINTPSQTSAVTAAGAGETLVTVNGLEPDDANFVKDAVAALTRAATNNGIFQVGQEDDGVVTLAQKVGDTHDMTTVDKINSYVSMTDGTAASSTTTGGLRLQIGEDSQPYNQLTVGINDIHVAALTISAADINIITQTGAAAAVDSLKTAINAVSSIRGSLGATQNRLEHTINNLSVMQENIQDAESSIRDVDVADEMMAYTKNNILVQSAQAMLAQANQVPQGVLQLLQ